MEITDDLKAAIRSALESELGDVYDCTRVWEAWSSGTMGPDDFEPVTERLEEIVGAILAALEKDAALPVVPATKYVPVGASLRDANWNHPNDDERCSPECRAALVERGDSSGQGLDGFWKWGFKAGWNAAAPSQPGNAQQDKANDSNNS